MKKKAFIILSFLLLAATAANGAVCPTVTEIGQLTDFRFNEPANVAVASDGTVYVADPVADAVFVFNSAGRMVKFMSIAQPFSVALDSSGQIYVGTKGKVTVYDSGFSLLSSFSLPRTVALPRDLLIQDGILYVVDGYIGTNEVQLFDINTFEHIGSFSGAGLEQPKGIAPLPSGGFTVVDNTRTAGGMGGAYIFNSSGGAVSGNFITYGLGTIPGDIASTGGVAADKSGRIIISDTLKSSLNVFDGSGNFITGCEFWFNQGPSDILYYYGMEYADNGKLYVAAKEKVYIFGVDDYTDMSVSPGSLTFDAQTCGQAVPAQGISIANGGPGILNWEIATDQPWLVPATTAGDINGVASVNVDINVDPSGLSIGTYTGTLTITSPGAVKTVKVTLNVGFTMPVLNVSPASLTFSVIGADIPPAQTVNIEFTGDLSGALAWNASADVPWLGITPSSGDSNTQALVNAGIEPAGLQGLDGGQYGGTITVTACAEGSPATVPVTLNYVPGGTINVTTNTEAASFTLDGPDSEQYSGSGTSYSVSGVTAGTYTITFDPVAGFKAPEQYSLEVLAGQDTDFEGNYRDLRERNNIIISVGDASASGPDEVKMFDGDGVQAGAVTVSEDSSSKRTVTASGDVDGDGVEELLVSHDLGIVSGFTNSGAAIDGLNFRAFPYKSVVDIAVADLDNDGAAEIIAGAGSGADNPAAVRVFKFTGGQVIDTGINFLAYQKRTGVHVAAGDVDGDGTAEILTLPGGSGSQAADIRIWKVQDGQAMAAGGFVAAGIEQPVDLAAGDLYADAVEEIILSSTTGGESRVDAYSADGTNVAGFATGFAKGAYIGAGDTDFNGTAEIVAGEPSTSGDPAVNVYDANGNILKTITPFIDKNIRGAEISLGKVVGQ